MMPNSIKYFIMDRHRYDETIATLKAQKLEKIERTENSLPCLLLLSSAFWGFQFNIGKFMRFLNVHYRVSSNESRGLKIP